MLSVIQKRKNKINIEKDLKTVQNINNVDEVDGNWK